MTKASGFTYDKVTGLREFPWCVDHYCHGDITAAQTTPYALGDYQVNNGGGRWNIVFAPMAVVDAPWRQPE